VKNKEFLFLIALLLVFLVSTVCTALASDSEQSGNSSTVYDINGPVETPVTEKEINNSANSPTNSPDVSILAIPPIADF